MVVTSGPYAVEQFRDHPIGYRPADLLAKLRRRFGPVVTLGRNVYLLGPEANRFVFANSGLFGMREAFEVLVPVDGPTSLIVSDGEDHRRRRRLVQPAMHHRQVDGYLETMASHADAAIDGWRTGQVVDVYQDFRAAIRASTIESLFGRDLAADSDFLGARLQTLLDLVDRFPPLVTAQRRLRTPGWRRAMTARAEVDERIYAEIARSRGEASGSVLATLVNGRDEESGTLSDLEVRDQVVTLIAAGYETTSAALAWAVYSLLSTTSVWDRAKSEVDEVLGGRRPTGEDLKRLPYLNGVVQETLRLYPPAVISARKVVQGFEFAGKRVPAGRMLLYSPYVTHRLPEVWADPLSFRPERWDPAARKPGPHEFLPFGGGPHRCIGSTMATAELTVMLARLVSRTSLRLPAQRLTPTSFAAMRPKHGLQAQIL
jgi:cytochrome P450